MSRERFAAEAMGELMRQYPNATRGWVRQMAWAMADTMLMTDDQCPDPTRPFADTPRVFAEDEAEHAATPDSCRVMGRFIVGFTG